MVTKNKLEIVDPYNVNRWQEKSYPKLIKRFSDSNRKIVGKYLEHMRLGRNTNGPKGPRSSLHLRHVVQKLQRLSEIFENEFGKALVDISEDELFSVVDGMRTGRIKTKNGKEYRATHDFIKRFKAFWRWYIKIKKREGVRIQDITEDLSGACDYKPEFVYFTFTSLQRMMEEATFEYRALMMFLFDTGIRSPTELMNVRLQDIIERPGHDIFECIIREETAKTFGRRVKLMLCSSILKRYIEKYKFSSSDFLFTKKPENVNEYLKRLSRRVFGQNLELLEENRSREKSLTMYDFRHSSCCYWVPRYKTEAALKYRFGWKRTEEIHYYSEFLGMKDTIQEEDLYIDTTKGELHREIELEKREREIMQDKFDAQQKAMQDHINKMENLLIKQSKSLEQKDGAWWSFLSS